MPLTRLSRRIAGQVALVTGAASDFALDVRVNNAGVSPATPIDTEGRAPPRAAAALR